MTRRRLMLLITAGGLAVVAFLGGVLTVMERGEWVLVLLTALAVMALMLLVDVRLRVSEITHLLRLSAERQREVSALLVTLVGSIEGDVDATSVRNSVLGRLEATEARVLDALAAIDLAVSHATGGGGFEGPAPTLHDQGRTGVGDDLTEHTEVGEAP